MFIPPTREPKARAPGFSGPEQGWPPRTVGVTNLGEIEFRPFKDHLNDELAKSLKDAALRDERVRRALRNRFAHIDIDEMDPPKDRKDERPSGYHTRFTFFSHARNVEVEVEMWGQMVVRVSDREGVGAEAQTNRGEALEVRVHLGGESHPNGEAARNDYVLSPADFSWLNALRIATSKGASNMANSGARPKLSVHGRSLAPDALVMRDPQASAAGELPEPRLPDEVRRREDASFGTGKPPKVNSPDWFLELGRRRAAPSEVIQVLLERLPDITDLRQAKLMINEIGRIESAGEVISRMITQDILSRLHRG